MKSILAERLPADWAAILHDDIQGGWFAELEHFLSVERRDHSVFPRADDVFAALHLTPVNAVRTVILGQDPYHDDGQAHGLAFSVRPGTTIPPSLRNIFKELQGDLNLPIPDHGCLKAWARQGVLLLNTVLTVRAHEPQSHRNRGWERLTDAIVKRLSEGPQCMVFLLWGRPARRKIALIDESRHGIFSAAHPSPLSAHRGFFGSRPFSQTNTWLQKRGRSPIDWALPPLQDSLPGLEAS